MNKAIVNQEIGVAYEVLQECGIAENGKIAKGFRSQISTFGAAVTMGSLKAAIAFFSDNKNAKVERSKLIKAIFEIIKKDEKNKNVDDNIKDLYDYVSKKNNEDECKEQIINAAIAIKLAMNLYELVD